MKKNIDLSTYTKAELIQLNKLVKIQYEHLIRLEQCQAITQYRVGDKVFFETQEGRKVKGTVVKLNKKTVTMAEDSSKMLWKVWPSLLNKIHKNEKDHEAAMQLTLVK